ncbi:MAG TPA: BadF/BadG/BcrA/BcrD ATPase family protein [Pyrinomonadaceae bacterium]|nr:BadF/BadG/BcrA/BcrD ATPase family protein [Pyrinomonadaceae bacterium]HMP65977.1 BadF/BadG/BcrA/BcrD ATPase family protein [Pyrinomonadaceae bacterium]
MARQKKRRNAGSALHQLYLGVDGGGTKTHIALMDATGAVRSEGFSGPSNPLRVGVETAVSNIIKAISEACDRGGLSRGDILAATLGLAGVRRADLRQRIRDSFLERLRVGHIEVVTDAEIALYAATEGKPGLVVIAGTGSICLGRNAKGKTAIAGGWGPLAGDEGGGVGIARLALQAVAKASDGRGISTVLSRRAAEYFRASGPENLIVAIYSPQVDNSRIAGFARLVVESALANDAVAVNIIKEAGFELGLAACAVIEKLGLKRYKVPVGCVGSLFKAGDVLKGPMIEVIHTVAPKAVLTEPLMPPAHAAALMALRNGNGSNDGGWRRC